MIPEVGFLQGGQLGGSCFEGAGDCLAALGPWTQHLYNRDGEMENGTLVEMENGNVNFFFRWKMEMKLLLDGWKMELLLGWKMELLLAEMENGTC